LLFVLQTQIPERIQHECIRGNFNQKIKVKLWHMGFFELCRPGMAHKICPLGEYCEYALFAKLFAHTIDEDLSPEEERGAQMEIEVQHLKKNTQMTG
jgi:hypothetical protein